MSQGMRLDGRFTGATNILYALNGTIFVSGSGTRKIVAVSSALAVLGDSGQLDASPGAIVELNGAVWCAFPNTARKFTNAAAPVQSVSVATNGSTNRWIVAAGVYIVAPGPTGGIVVIDTSGNIIQKADGLMSAITCAAATAGGIVYLFDGLGKCRVISINQSTGAISTTGDVYTNISETSGALSAAIDGTTLIIVNDSHVALISLATPLYPVLTSYTRRTEGLTDVTVLSAGHRWLSSERAVSTQTGAPPYASADSALGATALGVVYGKTSRVAFDTSPVTYDGTTVSLPNPAALNSLTFNNTVRAFLTVGNTLYVGGDFTTATDATGAQARTRLCAIDMGTGLLTSWAPACDGAVFAMCTDGTNIYAGGLFNNAGGSARVNLAAFVLGGALISWNPGTNNVVQALAYLGGVIYIGGQFSTLAATGRNFAGAVSTAGVLQAWAPDPNASVYCIAISGTNIYLGGGFSQTKGATIARSRGCVTDTAGTIGGWNAQADSGYIYGMQIVGTLVYIAGSFSAINGTARLYGAVIDTGNVLQAQNPTGDNQGQAAAVDAAANFYIGGTFTTLQATSRRFVGVIDPLNGLSAWSAGLTGGTLVYALAVVGGLVYMGGAFTNPSGGTNFYVKAVV